ncbi:hypothetical protein Tco_0917002, partial [Tanacetum coccineum]
AANLSTHTPEPSRCFNFIYYDDDDDDEESTIPLNEIISQIPPSIAITPVLPTMESEDSLIMGDENLSTIPEKESDKVIKSNVGDFVPIPSESEDTFESGSECDLPSCDDFSSIDVLRGNSMTFFNPLFDVNDDFTSSDDKSLPEEDVQEENFKIYSNPLFEFDEEYIYSDVNPLFNEVLEDIENKDSYVSNLDESDLLVTPLFDANEDECFDPGGDINKIDAFLDIDVSTDIEDGYHDSEGDIIYLECLITNDTTHNLPPEVFLDIDPKSLNDEPDFDNLKSMVKIFDPGIHEKKFSPTYVRTHTVVWWSGWWSAAATVIRHRWDRRRPPHGSEVSLWVDPPLTVAFDKPLGPVVASVDGVRTVDRPTWLQSQGEAVTEDHYKKLLEAHVSHSHWWITAVYDEELRRLRKFRMKLHVHKKITEIPPDIAI